MENLVLPFTFYSFFSRIIDKYQNITLTKFRVYARLIELMLHLLLKVILTELLEKRIICYFKESEKIFKQKLVRFIKNDFPLGSHNRIIKIRLSVCIID